LALSGVSWRIIRFDDSGAFLEHLLNSRWIGNLFAMNMIFHLIAHLFRSIALLSKPGDSKQLIAENLLLKKQF